MAKQPYLAFAILLAVSAVSAQTISERTRVSEDRMLSALDSFHLPVHKSQVQLLSAVSAKSGQANLQVVGVQCWNNRDALARFRCAKSGDCLPFYVVLHWPTSQDRDLALAGLNLNRTAHSSGRKEMLVRAGQKATLLVSDRKFQATAPIICLESGSQGQKVRIATLDHKRIARAEVIDRGVLRGSF
jgi:hypothetical protein